MIAKSVSSSLEQSSSHVTNQTSMRAIGESSEHSSICIRSGTKHPIVQFNEVSEENDNTEALVDSGGIYEDMNTMHDRYEECGELDERKQVVNTAKIKGTLDEASTSSRGSNILEDCSPQKRREKRLKKRKKKSLMEILFV